MTTEERKELHEQVRKENDHFIDLDELKPQKHNWVDRGLVMSCENAGHPNHRSFKINKGRA